MKMVFTAWLAMLVAGGVVFAQSVSTAQISGTVRDSSGASVPGADIKVVQTDTGLTRTVQGSADGSYVIPSLPVGPYRLEVTKSGFTTFVQTGIVLQVASNPAIDVTLQIGAVNQQVVVEASAAMVETQNSGVGQVVDQRRVVDLPLNGRNVTQLVFLAGAASQGANADLLTGKNYPNELVISVAGGMSNGLTYLLDGGAHNDELNGLGMPLPFPDALQEFKVETSALPAQYGEHSAGAVNAVTKSGTNQLHGDAFEFVRNYDFNARNWLAPTRDSLKRNQYGGTLGGRIIKDKLFFFAGYQGTAIRSAPSQAFGFEPTPLMLTGDFREFASPACNGGKQLNLKGGFVGNQISPSAFSSAAVKMMTYYPVTNDPCGKVGYSTINNQDEQTGVTKVDYQLSQNNSMFGRYFATHSVQPPTFNANNPLSMVLSGNDDLDQSFVFGDTHIFGPRTVNTVHFTWSRTNVTKTDPPTFDPQDLGVNMYLPYRGFTVITAGTLYSASVFAYPTLNIPSDPWNGLNGTVTQQIADDVSLNRGSHQMAFGANYIRPSNNAAAVGVGNTGQFTFGSTGTGAILGDFLMGDVATFSQVGLVDRITRHQYLGVYAQDTWKIKPRLTLTYGLRWEPFFGSSLPLGHVDHFDATAFANNVHSTAFPNAPAGLLFPGDAGFSGTGNRGYNIQWKDFAPRVGMVWDPKGDGKMSVRASWGMFYDLSHMLFDYEFSQTPPWSPSVSLTGGASANGWTVPFANPWLNYPGGNPFPQPPPSASTAFPTGANYATEPLNLKVNYIEQWNLSIQRQIGSSWLASLSYLGNNGIHMWTGQDLNPSVFLGNTATCTYGTITITSCNSTASTTARRILNLQNPSQGKYYGPLWNLDDGGTSSYNALLASVQHRLANNFTVLGNYTWSHCISDLITTELHSSEYTNPNNRRFDRGNCSPIDLRQIFNLSVVAQTPRFSNRALRMAGSNWKVGAIVNIQSGQALTVTTGVDNALNSLTGQRANLIASSPYCAVKSPTCWLNPAAFASPTNGTFGNMTIGEIRGPGTFTLDMSLSRLFKITERQQIEIRAEAFNVPNHFRPGSTPSGSSLMMLQAVTNGSNFGQIQIAADPRIMQFAIKYQF